MSCTDIEQYTNEEKVIARQFLDCHIPEAIKDNSFELEIDTMECYEALFDYAHCILDGNVLNSIFSRGLNMDAFNLLLREIKNDPRYSTFCEYTLRLLEVVKEYKRTH